MVCRSRNDATEWSQPMYSFLKNVKVPFNKDRAKDLILDLSNASDDHLLVILTHGLKQKGNDSYVQKNKDGSPKYPDTYARFVEVLSAVQKGEWAARDSGSFLDMQVAKVAKARYDAKKTGVKWDKLDLDAQSTAIAAIESDPVLMAVLQEMALEQEIALEAQRKRDAKLASLVSIT